MLKKATHTELYTKNLKSKVEQFRYIEPTKKAAEEDPRYEPLIEKIGEDKWDNFVETSSEAKVLIEQKDSIFNNVQSELNGKLDSYYKNNVVLSIKNYEDKLKQDVYNRVISVEEANEKLNSYQTQQINKYNLVEEDYNKKANELLQEKTALINKDIDVLYKSFREEYNIPYQDLDELNKIYSDAYKKTIEDEGNVLKNQENISEAINGKIYMAVSNLGKSFNESFSRSISSVGILLNQPSMVTFGDELATSFSIAPDKLENFSDVLDLSKVSKSVGRLAGSAATSIAVSSLVGAATSGLGVIPALAITSAAGMTTETMDMAGTMYRDVLAQTGSIDKANKARDEIVKAQMGNWYLYTFDGLPFVGKALRGIKRTGGRVLLAGGVESLTETAQEIPQTAQEETITERALSGEEITADGWFEKVTPKLTKETFLEVSPGSFLMGGGGRVMTEALQSGKKNKFVNELMANYAISNVQESDEFLKQKIVKSISRFGKDFTTSWVTTLKQTGKFGDEKAFSDAIRYINNANSLINSPTYSKLDSKNQSIYAYFLNEYETKKQEAELSKDPISQINAKDAKNQLDNFISFVRPASFIERSLGEKREAKKPAFSYVEVQLGKRDAVIMSGEQLIKMTEENPDYFRTDLGLDLKVTINNNPELTEQFNERFDAINDLVKEPTSSEDAPTEVEELRAEEQAEMLEQIPGAENALTDGKVDREKIATEEGKAKFDEIYSEYDEKISPLLETAPAEDVETQKADIERGRKEELEDYYSVGNVVNPVLAHIRDQINNTRLTSPSERKAANRFLKSLSKLNLSQQEVIDRLNKKFDFLDIQYKETEIDRINLKYDARVAALGEAAPVEEILEEDTAIEAEELARQLGLDEDAQFQLETDITSDERKKVLEKQAKDLMNEVQPENVETIEDVKKAEPIPVNLKENTEPVERTGIERFNLNDIVDKKFNLLMADKLKIQLKDPSKPYNKETNPYVKMGGNFFPLMEDMFGKVAWASIKDAAATKIIKGAMDGDFSAVYNMGDSGVDSNIVMAESLSNAIPENIKTEIFQLIKDRVLKSNANEIKKAHKHFKDASTIMEAFESLTDSKNGEKVDVRAAVINLIVPSESNASSTIELHKKMRELGISIESLRNENAEQFAKELPDGAITMIVEVQDENGVPVRERKKQLDKDLADNKITKKEYNKSIGDVIQSAKMTLEQQTQEGVPVHPNYPIYIRGKAIALMEETASFFDIIPEYRGKFNERVAGIDKKKTGKVKEGATPLEESIYKQISKAKKKDVSTKAKKEIIEALLKGDVKKLKNGKVKTQTIALLKDAIKLNNKATIGEILAKAETPFAETTQYTAGDIRSAAMTSGMTTSTTSYRSIDNLQTQYTRFLERLSKAFPTVEVVLNQSEFENILANAQSKSLVLKNQKVYGAVYQGKLYLNPNLPNYNTPIHEFGHIWLNVAKEMSPDLYLKGMELITKDSPYYQNVVNSKEYAKIIDKMRKDGVTDADIEAYIKEEALATAIGDKGESFASAAQEKNLKNWLNELFDFIRKLVGISKITAEQLQNITLDEFVQAVVVDIMSENEVFLGAEVKSLGEQLQLMVVPEKSMGEIIKFGRAESFSDASIKFLLKKRGFKVADINNAMAIDIGIDVKMPNEFSSIKGGVNDAIELFEDTRKKLSSFAKGKRKEIKNKPLTAEEKKSRANKLRTANPSIFELTDEEILKKYPIPKSYETISSPTLSQIREKAIELLEKNSIFQSQTKAIQDSLIVAFDRTLKTKANKVVQDRITNIRNKIQSRKETVKEISEFQKELKSILKSIPTNSSVKRIIKAVGEINQDNVLAQADIISNMINKLELRDKAFIAKQEALKDKILNLKEDAKFLKSLKNDARRFIANVLPANILYTKGELGIMNAVIDNINAKNHSKNIERVFDLVDKKTEQLRTSRINSIVAKVAEYAKPSIVSGRKRKAKTLEARGQSFFEQAKKILSLAIKNDKDALIDIAQELSDVGAINEVLVKEQLGEELTVVEQKLLDKVYAFDTFSDILNMSLDELILLEESISDVKKESSLRLKQNRVKRANDILDLYKEGNNQVGNNWKGLYNIDGTLKDNVEKNKTPKSITEMFKDKQFSDAAKKLISKIWSGEFMKLIPNLIRDNIIHMGTVSNILDKGTSGNFFTDNIYRPLNIMRESYLSGYIKQESKLDEISNSINGIKDGYKEIKKLLQGDGMMVEGVAAEGKKRYRRN